MLLLISSRISKMSILRRSLNRMGFGPCLVPSLEPVWVVWIALIHRRSSGGGSRRLGALSTGMIGQPNCESVWVDLLMVGSLAL